MNTAKPFVVIAVAFAVAAVLGAGVGAILARFTPEDLFDVDITPEGDGE